MPEEVKHTPGPGAYNIGDKEKAPSWGFGSAPRSPKVKEGAAGTIYNVPCAIPEYTTKTNF